MKYEQKKDQRQIIYGPNKDFPKSFNMTLTLNLEIWFKITANSFLWVKYKTDWANWGEYMVGISTTCKSAIVRP